MTSEDRFWSKVDTSGECWEWTAAKRRNGYGVFRWKGKLCSTHRVSYELTFGDIPHDLCVLHRCDNRACVRPDHLFLGTFSDNMYDCARKGRILAQKNPWHWRKLTSAQVVELRRLRSEGFSYNRLAKLFGIHRETARTACNREHYAEV